MKNRSHYGLSRRQVLLGAIAGTSLLALPTLAQEKACEIVSSQRSTIVQRGNKDRAEFCLTYDDCWDEALTYKIGEALSQRGLQATFFPAGIAIRANIDNPTEGYENLYSKLLDMGHEFGCHTFSHPDITDYSARALLYNEVLPWQDVLEEALGAPYETAGFRPPYGITTDALFTVSIQTGLPIVLWSADMQDHLCSKDPAICQPILEKRFENTLKNGALYLHHCTEGALGVLAHQVAIAEEMSLRHVLLSELLVNFCG